MARSLRWLGVMLVLATIIAIYLSRPQATDCPTDPPRICDVERRAPSWRGPAITIPAAGAITLFVIIWALERRSENDDA